MKNCLHNELEKGGLKFHLRVHMSALEMDSPDEGLQSGVDIFILTGYKFCYFNTSTNAWIGGMDDFIFKTLLPPVIIVCLKFGAKEIGTLLSYSD